MDTAAAVQIEAARPSPTWASVIGDTWGTSGPGPSSHATQVCKLDSRQRHHHWCLATTPRPEAHVYSRQTVLLSRPYLSSCPSLHRRPWLLLLCCHFPVCRFPFQPLPHSLNRQPNSKFTSSRATLDYHPHTLRYPVLEGILPSLWPSLHRFTPYRLMTPGRFFHVAHTTASCPQPGIKWPARREETTLLPCRHQNSETKEQGFPQLSTEVGNNTEICLKIGTLPNLLQNEIE